MLVFTNVYLFSRIKRPKVIKYYRNTSVYDYTRIWRITKMNHKKFTDHCLFSTKS